MTNFAPKSGAAQATPAALPLTALLSNIQVQILVHVRSNEGVCHVCHHCLHDVVLPVNKDTIAPTNTEY